MSVRVAIPVIETTRLGITRLADLYVEASWLADHILGAAGRAARAGQR